MFKYEIFAEDLATKQITHAELTGRNSIFTIPQLFTMLFHSSIEFQFVEIDFSLSH